jgi:quercetin dioxygenase-like cupin family protein
MQFSDLSEIKERELIPGFHGRVIHTDSMTFVYWLIDKGAPLPEHSHPHEQVAHVFEGQFELTIDGETRTLEPETVAAIPGNAIHSGKAITQCRILDVFSPVREDYR